MRGHGEHLSAAQLVACLNGGLDDPEIRAHLATCARCRARVESSLQAQRLLSPRRTKPEAGHPSDDVLLALLQDGLSPSRRTTVERHVRSCGSCGEKLARLEQALPAEARTPPPAGIVAATKRRLRFAREVRRLGRVLALPVEGLAKLSLTLQPEELLRASEVSLLGADPEKAGAVFSSPIAEQSLDRLAVDEPPPLVLDDGMLRMTLTGVVEGDAVGLELLLVDPTVGRPVDGVEVVLAHESGVSRTARTGEDGKARFKLTPGRSLLRIETRPVREVEIDSSAPADL